MTVQQQISHVCLSVTQHCFWLVWMNEIKLMWSPGQTDSQVDASFQNQTICTDLRWVAKRIRKSALNFTQVAKSRKFHAYRGFSRRPCWRVETMKQFCMKIDLQHGGNYVTWKCSIHLICDQLASTCVGSPNDGKLPSTRARVSARPKSTQVIVSPRKWMPKGNKSWTQVLRVRLARAYNTRRMS